MTHETTRVIVNIFEKIPVNEFLVLKLQTLAPIKFSPVR